jgi:hypothetical protein
MFLTLLNVCSVCHLSVSIKSFTFFLHYEGPRSRCYGRTTALRLFVQPYDEDEDEDEQFFLPSFTSNGAPVE